MFCYKCGTELSDGAAFCHKCGAKMVEENVVKTELEQRNATTRPVGEPQPNIALNVPEKKKSRKLPIILGVLALVIVSIGVYLGIHDDNDYSRMTELTKTFTSKTDDVSFQYPKAWKIVDSDEESVIVRLGNADIYSFIYVRKFADDPDDTDNLYDLDDEYFLEYFGAGDNTVESTSMVDINGFPAREVYYSTPDSHVGTVYYRTYLYAHDSVTYRIDLVKKEVNPIDVDRVFDAIMNSYTITAVPDAGRSESVETEEVEKVTNSWQTAADSDLDVADESVAYEELEDSFTASAMSIEDYYRLGGLYSDSIGYTNLGLGIYTSQEEGETAIGTAALYMDDEGSYLGDIFPLEEGVYRIAGQSEDEMILKETEGDGIILLLYINGEYIDAYRMIEHYEP